MDLDFDKMVFKLKGNMEGEIYLKIEKYDLEIL